jgi:hypothetical protein
MNYVFGRNPRSEITSYWCINRDKTCCVWDQWFLFGFRDATYHDHMRMIGAIKMRIGFYMRSVLIHTFKAEIGYF